MANSAELLTASIAALREKAAQYRKLALEHAEADHEMIATKLRQVAAELETKAARLAATGSS